MSATVVIAFEIAFEGVSPDYIAAALQHAEKEGREACGATSYVETWCYSHGLLICSMRAPIGPIKPRTVELRRAVTGN